MIGLVYKADPTGRWHQHAILARLRAHSPEVTSALVIDGHPYGCNRAILLHPLLAALGCLIRLVLGGMSRLTRSKCVADGRA